jgi:hypothetical protein
MLEIALWSSVRALEEQMMLAKRIIERARKANKLGAVRVFDRRASAVEEQSSAIQQLLLRGKKDGIAETPIQNRDDELIVS